MNSNDDNSAQRAADIASAQQGAAESNSQGSPELRSESYPNGMVRAPVMLTNGVRATLLVDESAIGWAELPGRGGIMALLLKQTETPEMAFARARKEFPELDFAPMETSALQQPRPVNVILSHSGFQELC